MDRLYAVSGTASPAYCPLEGLRHRRPPRGDEIYVIPPHHGPRMHSCSLIRDVNGMDYGRLSRVREDSFARVRCPQR